MSHCRRQTTIALWWNNWKDPAARRYIPFSYLFPPIIVLILLGNIFYPNNILHCIFFIQPPFYFLSQSALFIFLLNYHTSLKICTEFHDLWFEIITPTYPYFLFFFFFSYSYSYLHYPKVEKVFLTPDEFYGTPSMSKMFCFSSSANSHDGKYVRTCVNVTYLPPYFFIKLKLFSRQIFLTFLFSMMWNNLVLQFPILALTFIYLFIWHN